MTKLLITTKAILASDTPMPQPSLIADLLDAVLKAPGLRVTSVEVTEIGETSTITRRVRNLRASAASKSPATTI